MLKELEYWEFRRIEDRAATLKYRIKQRKHQIIDIKEYEILKQRIIEHCRAVYSNKQSDKCFSTCVLKEDKNSDVCPYGVPKKEEVNEKHIIFFNQKTIP
jgi:hypothetical protein